MNGERTGIFGSWDRVVGPGASTLENAGTLGLAAAGGVLAPRLEGVTTARGSSALALRLMAIDLWGGAWCNNTPSCARWYERPGQGPRQHLVFAAAHLHPFAVAWLDRGSENRGLPWWAWGAGHYGYLLMATALVSHLEGRRRRGAGVVTTLIGAGLDFVIGRSTTAPWFGPVFYSKLLAGHAAGAVFTPIGQYFPYRRHS